MKLPSEDNGNSIQLSPAKRAIISTEIISLTTHLLNPNTKYLELFNKNEDLVIKWWDSSITSSDYDYIIPVSQVRHLVVPKWETNIMIAKLEDKTLPTKLYLIES